MDAQERMRVRHELEALLMEYWHDVDTNWGRNAGDYYTDDALFESSQNSYKGKAKIKQFYQYRLDRGPRVAVHAVTNFRVVMEGPDRAICNWYLLLFAADGKPILPTNPPIQIAHMTDHCVRQPDGRWLYEYRKFDAWFEGGAPTTNPNLDDK